MKQNIPSGHYEHIKSTYIPLMEGGGSICENCGRLIANIVTVKHETGKYFIIGADCAKTVLNDKQQKASDEIIKKETRISKKIAELNKAGRPFVLNDNGIPCFPPETRHGYYIPY